MGVDGTLLSGPPPFLFLFWELGLQSEEDTGLATGVGATTDTIDPRCWAGRGRHTQKVQIKLRAPGGL